MPGTPSSIPVGTQFSPALFDLGAFVAALVRCSGSKGAIQDAIWVSPIRLKPHKSPTRRMKALPVEAAVQYGLLDGTYSATPLTRQLAVLRPPKLYEEFAHHILLKRGGLRVVEAVQQMRDEGRRITGDTLAEYLTDQGFTVTIHNTAINTMRMWLEKAGVFLAGWDIDSVKLEQIIGLSRAEIAALVGLDPEQQSFLLALCRIDPPGKCSASDVREMAEQILCRRIPRDSLPKRVLADLKSLGLLDYESKGTAGGKAAKLWTTAKFRKEVLDPFLSDAVKELDAVLSAYYQAAPASIYAAMSSTDRAAKGKALEAYAIHIMRLMGFRFVGWRKRAKDSTGYAEVDVVMTGLFGNSPTRWQVQCKNTPTSAVDLEDVAKEVGLLPVTKATHILIIANCHFTLDAQRFANEIMNNSPVTIFLLNSTDFAKVRTSPGSLAAILRSKAEEMSRRKRGTTMWGW